MAEMEKKIKDSARQCTRRLVVGWLVVIIIVIIIITFAVWHYSPPAPHTHTRIIIASTVKRALYTRRVPSCVSYLCVSTPF